MSLDLNVKLVEALDRIAFRSNIVNENWSCFWCLKPQRNQNHDECFDEFKSALISLFNSGRKLDESQSIKRNRSKR